MEKRCREIGFHLIALMGVAFVLHFIGNGDLNAAVDIDLYSYCAIVVSR